MERIINVAVIGTGFGSIIHLPGYQKNDKYRLVGICGHTFEKADSLAKQYNIKAYKSVDEIINDNEVELVSIATIPYEHYEMVEKVILSGKNIVLEKPMAMNIEQSSKMMRLADEYGVFTALVHEHRFDPAKVYAKHIIKNNVFGAIRSIEIVKHMTYWNNIFSGRNYDWFSNMSLGGGMIGGHLSHQIDFLHYIDGIPLKFVSGRAYVEVKKRYSKTLEREENQTSDDTVFSIIETKSGIPVIINISASKFRALNYIKIFTSEGEIVISGQSKIEIFDKTGNLVANEIPMDFQIKDYGTDSRLNTFICFLDRFYDHYFRGIPQDITTFKEGHEIQKVLDSIERL